MVRQCSVLHHLLPSVTQDPWGAYSLRSSGYVLPQYKISAT